VVFSPVVRHLPSYPCHRCHCYHCCCCHWLSP
jgi:hypothetical protein